MTFRITHRTTYRYADSVTVSQHAARMEPRVTDHQRRDRFKLQIKPAPALQSEHDDYFGNRVCVFSVQGLHRELEVTATSTVHTMPPAKIDLNASLPFARVREMFRDPVSPELCGPYQFVFDSPQVRCNPDYAYYALASFTPDTPMLAGVRDFTHRLHQDFKFDPTATTVATPLDEVWKKRRGVCQDFAHMAIACLRSIGLPARYVSGYLRTLPPPGKPRLVGADQSHAWFSVYCPAMQRWIDFDPTNDCLAGEDHPVVAFGRDFSDVSPLIGIITGGGEHQVIVGVDVEPV
jgi:transglutaminase-like putative cysteine protease